MAKPLMKSFDQPKQATFHVKKGDEVVVISGAQRGSRGKVLSINRSSNRVLVEGVRLIKKADRPTQENPKGGISEREGSIHISNLMLAADFAKRKSSTSSEAKPTKAKAAKKD